MGIVGQHLAHSATATEITHLSWPQMLSLLSQSIIVGLLLMGVTYLNCISQARQARSQSGEGSSAHDSINESANVLLICFGMTSVMLLVSNNLARAFTIGAAIALVRFRVKVDNRGLAMSLFYGVLAGMACGVEQTQLAWMITGLYGILQLIIGGFRKLTSHVHLIPRRTHEPQLSELPPVP